MLKPPLPKTPMPKQMTLEEFVATLAKLLDLPDTTPPDELLDSLKAALRAPPDPAKFLPVTAMQEILQRHQTDFTTQREDRIKARVGAALRDHYITNGMKDWATALCRSDEVAFDTFCKDNGPMFAYLFKPAGGVARVAEQTTSLGTDLETSVCEQLGLKPGSLRT